MKFWHLTVIAALAFIPDLAFAQELSLDLGDETSGTFTGRDYTADTAFNGLITCALNCYNCDVLYSNGCRSILIEKCSRYPTVPTKCCFNSFGPFSYNIRYGTNISAGLYAGH